MKISIITAAFNSGRTLRDTMKSVLSQSYTNWEHIVIDGGSKDDTIDIIHEMEPLYGGRLKWISEKDGGIYDAMNKGIKMSSGDVIGILNSDDYLTSDKVLEEVAWNMEKYNPDAVYGDIHFVNVDDPNTCVRYYSSRFFSRWMMLMGYQPAHPSFYCKRECYEKYGLFDTDFRIAADFENMFRMIYIHGIKIIYLPLDFVTMRIGGASTNGFASHRQIITDHLKTYHKHHIKKAYGMDFMRYPFKLAEILVSRLYSYNFHKKEASDHSVI